MKNTGPRRLGPVAHEFQFTALPIEAIEQRFANDPNESPLNGNSVN